MKEYLIRLSWPDRALSSNARVHWSKLAKATGAYKLEAWTMCQHHHVATMPNAVLEFSFSPPDNRRRDAHNMPHMMKSAIDGIAAAMGCDDQGFRCIFPSSFAKPVKHGCVLIHIKEREETT